MSQPLKLCVHSSLGFYGSSTALHSCVDTGQDALSAHHDRALRCPRCLT